MGTSRSFSRANRDLDFTNVKPPTNNTITKSLDTFSSSNNSSKLFTKRSSIDSSTQQLNPHGKKQPNYSPEISFIFKSSPNDYDKTKRRPNSLPLSIERRPQDKFFFYLFLFAILVSVYTVFDAKYLRKANINLVLNGHDDWGNICGQSNREIRNAMWSGQNMTNRKYMLLRLGRNHTINSICIENCTFNDYFKTAFNRCLPKPLLLNPMFSMINITKGFLEEIMVDSLLCWREIILLCTISISFSFALLILIGFFVGVIIWIILFMMTGLIVLITIYFWSSWYVARERSSILKNEIIVRQSRMMFLANKSQENWLLLSISSTLFSILVILIIFYLRKSLRLVSLLFKEAGKATTNMPSILLLPFFTLAALFAACFYTTLAVIYIKSDQHPVVRLNSTVVDYKLNPSNYYLIWLNIAIFIWVCHFIYACQHYITSASIAKWYFKRNRKLRCPILASTIEMFRFHLGSLAFGSLIVTGIKVFRILISKLESIRSKDNPSMAGKFISFLVMLFEKLVLFINKNAYIIIALHGTSFCESSKTAFKIILSKSFKIAIVNLVADFILFVGKIVVVLVTLLIGIEFIKDKEEKLNYSWGPLLIPTLFSYFIAHCFLTVYEMIIDTLFVCFCEDSKLDEIESSSQSSNQSFSSSSSSNNDLNVSKNIF